MVQARVKHWLGADHLIFYVPFLENIILALKIKENILALKASKKILALKVWDYLVLAEKKPAKKACPPPTISNDSPLNVNTSMLYVPFPLGGIVYERKPARS